MSFFFFFIAFSFFKDLSLFFFFYFWLCKQCSFFFFSTFFLSLSLPWCPPSFMVVYLFLETAPRAVCSCADFPSLHVPSFFFSLLEPSRWGTAFTLCKSMKVGLFFFTCLWRRSTKRWKKKNSRAKKKERRKTRKYKRETDPVIRWSKATNSHSHTHTHTHTHLWPVQC